MKRSSQGMFLYRTMAIAILIYFCLGGGDLVLLIMKQWGERQCTAIILILYYIKLK